jgi:methionyl-tRNA synthetase
MQDYIDDFIKKENGGPQLADALRYYLTTILPETKDSEFTWKGFQEAVNGELVAIFANFFNRTFVLMHKLTNGKVPKFHNDAAGGREAALISVIQGSKTKIEPLLEHYKFRDALFEVIDLARQGNRYLQEKEPWIKVKQASGEGTEATTAQIDIDNCLHLCLQLCANLAIYINPFLPNTAKKMCHMMKVVDKMLEWENAGKTKLLSVGYSLRAPELLFRKIEDAEIAAQVQKLKTGLEQSKMENEPAANNMQTTKETPSVAPNTTIEAKGEIQYEDFKKLDLRVGTITAAAKVEKADKLLKLEVDMGSEKRTIVSGIAQHFSPDDILNKQVVVVANLAPRKMRGIESAGMILMAEDEKGKLHFISPESIINNGSTVS